MIKQVHKIFLPIKRNWANGIQVGPAHFEVGNALALAADRGDIYQTELIGLPKSVERDITILENRLFCREELLREVLGETGLSERMRHKIMHSLYPAFIVSPEEMERMKQDLQRVKADVAKLDKQITLATGGTR